MAISKIVTNSVDSGVTLTSPVINTITSASATALTLQSAGTTAITVNTSQNVGIGTTAPTYQTQIYGLGQETGNLTDAGNKGGSLYLQATAVGAGSGGAVLFGTNFGNATPFAAIKGYINDGATNTRGTLVFSTRSLAADTSLTQRMCIDYNGNVGIGTSSPVNRLDVIGAAGCTYFAADTTITDTTLRTYTANTIYTLPGNVALLGTGGDTFLVSIFIQYDSLGYHSWTGSLVVSQTYWQAGGTVASWATQMSTHVNSNPTVTIYDTAGSGSRPMAFAVNQTIVVATGGFVKVTFKRIMSF